MRLTGHVIARVVYIKRAHRRTLVLPMRRYTSDGISKDIECKHRDARRKLLGDVRWMIEETDSHDQCVSVVCVIENCDGSVFVQRRLIARFAVFPTRRETRARGHLLSARFNASARERIFRVIRERFRRANFR